MLLVEILKVKVVQVFLEVCFFSGIMVRSFKYIEEEKVIFIDIENVESDVLFECFIDGCICFFDFEIEFQRYLDVGNYVCCLYREFQFDYIRCCYVDVVNDELLKLFFGVQYLSVFEQSGKRVSNIIMGWVLKKYKFICFFIVVKVYLNDKFFIGEEMGNKVLLI